MCKPCKAILLILVMMNLLSCSAEKKINRLLETDDSQAIKTYRYGILKDLPQPVQRYFRYALTDSQPFVTRVSIEHKGRFRNGPEKKWMDIRGEQTLTAGKPGFVWVGKTRMFTAHDSYISGHGNMAVFLLGSFRIVNEEGYKVNQGELLRWLGESVWMPTNLLPNENIHWEAIDENHARLVYTGWKENLSYVVEFASNGRIVSMECMRYKGQGSLHPWVGRLSNYQEQNGMMVPQKIQGSWIQDDGSEFMYADFDLIRMIHRFTDSQY